MGTLGDWLSIAKQVVFSPKQFYQNIQDHDSLVEPLLFAVLSTLIFSLLQLVIQLGTSTVVLEQLPLVLATYIGTALLAGSLGVLFGAGILHIFIYLLGGRGYTRTVTIVGFSAAVNAVFGWIPFVNIIAGLYTLYIQIIGVKTLHRFTTARAVAAVLLPIGIGLLITLGAVFLTLTASGTGLTTFFDTVPGVSSTSNDTGAPAGGTGQCLQATPQFVGAPIMIDQWAFTGTNEIQLLLRSRQDTITLEHVRFDYDQDGDIDATFPTRGAYNEVIAFGETATITVDTGNQFSSGDCASATVTLQFTRNNLDSTSRVTSSQPLQGRVP